MNSEITFQNKVYEVKLEGQCQVYRVGNDEADRGNKTGWNKNIHRNTPAASSPAGKEAEINDLSLLGCVH